jgi:hypothetical protein
LSDDGPEWFRQKRYGFGPGLPIRWQGWAVTAAFIGFVLAVSAWFKDKPLVTVALMVPAAVAFLTIVVKTTPGVWRWRWGDEDD